MLARIPIACHVVVEAILLGQPHVHAVGAAQPPGEFHQRIQHGLKIERRAADDLEYVGGGGLLLQRFCAAHSSSRVFSTAMTAWAAKFCSSSICLSVNGRTSCR